MSGALSQKIWGEISEGAIFIADAHENSRRRLLERLWSQLEREESSAPIFLMGDIFDLLFGSICSSVTPHEALLARISTLAKNRPIYWLEGNHDFDLKGVIPHVVVIAREEQPAAFWLKGELAWLAHGDWRVGSGYELYTRLIRNRAILKGLDLADRLCGGRLFERVRLGVEAKILRQGEVAERLAQKRLKLYERLGGKWVFEGHFHSSGVAKLGAMSYVALPSLGCNESFFVVKSARDAVSIKESILKES